MVREFSILLPYGETVANDNNQYEWKYRNEQQQQQMNNNVLEVDMRLVMLAYVHCDSYIHT